MPPKGVPAAFCRWMRYVPGALADEFLIKVGPGVLQFGISDVRQELDAGGHRVELESDFLLRRQILDGLGVDRRIGVVLAGVLVADAGSHSGLLLFAFDPVDPLAREIVLIGAFHNGPIVNVADRALGGVDELDVGAGIVDELAVGAGPDLARPEVARKPGDGLLVVGSPEAEELSLELLERGADLLDINVLDIVGILARQQAADDPVGRRRRRGP